MKGSKNEQKIEDDIERLKEWLSKQPHLPHDLEDDMLKAFVCGTKSLEIAKSKLDSWFKDRGNLPHFFSYESRNPFADDFKEQSKAVKFYILPNRAPDGSAVIMHDFITMENMDFRNYHLKETMTMELVLKLWPDVTGVFTVYNVEGIDSSILGKLSPRDISSISNWFHNSFPAKMKVISIVQAPSWIEKALNNFVKPFIKEKIFKRIVITSDGKESLKNVLPVEILPRDYGGQEKHSDELQEDLQKKFEEHADWFKNISLMVSDETKRPPDENNTYGINGTFRSLSMD